MRKLTQIFSILGVILLGFACSQQEKLYFAVNTGNVSQVAKLIEKGVNVNGTGSQGSTPLIAACVSQQPEIAKMLIKAGANVNAAEGLGGNTALMYATLGKRPDMVKMLLEAGADVNMTNKMGRTALMFAIRNDDIDTVKLLLVPGANVNVLEVVGKGPFEGKPVKIMAGNGWSPLMYAIYYSGIDTVKVLLDAGADVNLKTVKSDTALQLAQKIAAREIPMQIRKTNLTVEQAGEIENYMQLQNRQVDEQFNEMQEIIKLLKSAGAKE